MADDRKQGTDAGGYDGKTQAAMGEHVNAIGGTDTNRQGGAPTQLTEGMGGTSDAGSAAQGGTTSDLGAIEDEMNERTGRTDQVAGGVTEGGGAGEADGGRGSSSQSSSSQPSGSGASATAKANAESHFTGPAADPAEGPPSGAGPRGLAAGAPRGPAARPPHAGWRRRARASLSPT